MDRNIMIGIAIGLVAGLGLGYYFGSNQAGAVVTAPLPAPSAPGAAPFQGQVPQGMGGTNSFELQRRIFANQQLVATDPKNVQAWVALGNDHFDLHQPEKSVEAYGKALELAGPNPDLLTDQGVMYREMKAFDKAIANFEKANKLNPKHLQSLFNLGIVYSEDKKDLPKAIKVWNQLIAIDPASPQAAQARQAIKEHEGPNAHK
jgi:cytochrome c-type biogenesis protein CcmH/NrfG